MISFSSEGFSCQAALWVQFITIYLSKVEKLFKLTHKRQYSEKRQKQVFSRQHILSPSSKILQTVTTTDENIFCKAQTFSI